MGDYKSGYDPKYGYNKNAFAHGTVGTAVMGQVVKLIATPIGLVSEAVHSHKSKSGSTSQTGVTGSANPPLPASGEQHNTPSDLSGEVQTDKEQSAYIEVPPDQAQQLIASGQAEPADGEEHTHELVPENDGMEHDEVDWVLDDAISETETQEPPFEDQDLQNQTMPVTNSSKNTLRKLPFPIILPQRRPGTKTRGFVRAYSPILEEMGISQDAFLWFLKDFHKSAQASPIFDVVIVATAIAGFYPDLVVGLAVQAVQIIAAAGQEVQERLRTNHFLTRANKDIFIPKGMFAMIVTYKKGSSDQTVVSTEQVDLGATAIARYGDGAIQNDSKRAEGTENVTKIDEMKEKMKKLRIASGETDEGQMPTTCAPLIYPALDAAPKATMEGHEAGSVNVINMKSKHAQKFVNDYFDRRAQADYAFNNPNSTLTAKAAPATPFKSRFADPNNQTNKHLFTLLTGGKFKAEPLGAKRRWEKAQRKAAEKRAQGIRETSSKRLMQENVLYLMIVNMPTEAELEKAKTELRVAKEKKAAEKAEKKASASQSS